MIRRCFALAALLAVTTLAAELEDNAALLYWQAFAALPEIPEEQVPEDWHDLPVNDVTRDFFNGRAQAALRLLHRGAAIADCAWALPLADGPNLRLPHLAKARELARLAVADASFRCATGEPGRAAEDYLATLQLARHVGASTLIAYLVSVAIEDLAIEGIARHLGDFSAAQVAALLRDLAELPPPATLRQALAGEQAVFGGYLRRAAAQANADGRLDRILAELRQVCPPALSQELAEALADPDQLLAIIATIEDDDYRELAPMLGLPPKPAALVEPLSELQAIMAALPPEQAEVVASLLPSVFPTPRDIATQLAALDQDYERLQAIAALPPGERAAAQAELQRRQQTATGLGGLHLPTLGGILDKGDAAARRRQMLRALLTWQSGGADIPADPVTGGPFTIVANAEAVTVTAPGGEGQLVGLLTPTAPVAAAEDAEAPLPPLDPKAVRRLEQLRAMLQGLGRTVAEEPEKVEQLLGGLLKPVAAAHPEWQPTEEERTLAAALFADSIAALVQTWTPIIDRAITGDPSARITIDVLNGRDGDALLLRYFLHSQRPALVEVFGEDKLKAMEAATDRPRK